MDCNDNNMDVKEEEEEEGVARADYLMANKRKVSEIIFDSNTHHPSEATTTTTPQAAKRRKMSNSDSVGPQTQEVEVEEEAKEKLNCDVSISPASSSAAAAVLSEEKSSASEAITNEMDILLPCAKRRKLFDKKEQVDRLNYYPVQTTTTTLTSTTTTSSSSSSSNSISPASIPLAGNLLFFSGQQQSRWICTVCKTKTRCDLRKCSGCWRSRPTVTPYRGIPISKFSVYSPGFAESPPSRWDSYRLPRVPPLLSQETLNMEMNWEPSDTSPEAIPLSKIPRGTRETGACGFPNPKIVHTKYGDVCDPSMTRIHHAAFYGHLDCLEVLIKMKADVNETFEHSRHTPLLFAASNGQIDCLKLLLKSNADPQSTGRFLIEALLRSTRNGHTECALQLLESTTTGHRDKLIIFLDSARSGHLKLMVFLMKAHKFGVRNLTIALCKAANNGHFDCMTTLLNSGASATGSYYPIHFAARNGHVKCVDKLLKSNADLHAEDTFGHHPIHKAIVADHTECLEYLISKNADLHAFTHEGFQPIHIASQSSSPKSLQILINQGAMINVRDVWGDRPIHHAVRNDAIECIKILNRHGANLLCPNRYLHPPIVDASMGGTMECVQTLMPLTDIFVRDRSGQIPRSHCPEEEIRDVLYNKEFLLLRTAIDETLDQLLPLCVIELILKFSMVRFRDKKRGRV